MPVTYISTTLKRLNIMPSQTNFFDKLKKKLYKKNKLSKFERQTKRFKERYPHYTIGNGSYGVPEVHDWNEHSTLKIGAFCSISAYVQIFLGGEHRIDWVTTSPLNVMFKNKKISNHARSKGDVIIGNDVWICANAVILSGVTIGDGAIIGNSAIVTRDIEPYSIVAGNPAKHIKYRFTPYIIDELLKIQWWNWSEQIIRDNMHILLNTDIDSFILQAKSINKDLENTL